MKKKTNRLLSILLCCVMLIGLLPTAAFAWTAPTLTGGKAEWNVQLSDEGVLTWNDMGSATYDIQVDETAMGGTVTKIQGISGTSYNLINRFKELKIENGTYYFYIKANDTDTTSGDISFKYVSPQDKLSAPQNLRWDGTVAKWDSVANATGYTVNLYTDDGYLQLSKTATTTQYDWTTEAEDGRWFEVVATADNYRDSNPAEGPRYGTYSWTAPTLTGGKAEWNVTLSDDGMLRWNDMGSATYDISVDETAMGGTVTNIYNINTNAFNLINRFKELKLENGTYYFSIKANDTDTTSGDISFKYVSPEDKLPAPQNLTWDGTVAKWDSVANATEYNVILYTESGSVQLSKTTTEPQYDWTTEATDGRWFEVVATAPDYRDSNPAESPKYVVVSYSIGAYPYDATVSKTQAGGQVIMTTDAGAGEWSSDGYIKTATEGTTVTLNAMPATGYKFVEWRQGTAGAQISTSASYEFQASEDKYLYAIFQAIETTEYQIELQIFDITYTATAGGTVKVETNKGSAEGTNPKAYATKGTAVTITAVPAQGYEFVAWKKYTPHYSTAFSTETTYTFTAEEPAVIPSDDPPLFLYAVFQEVQQVVPKYEINCVAHNLSDTATAGTVFVETDMGGTGYAPSQQEHATANTTVTVRAVAEPGYQFVAWRKGSPTDANATVSTNTEYQFTATEAVWMYAVFEYTPECTIDCTVFDITGGINNGQGGVGGTVSIQTDKGSVEGATPLPIKATRNSSVTVNAVAAQGYKFLGWKKNSPYVQDFVATTASYTFDINEELYLYAVFQETSPVVGSYIDFLITDLNVQFAETGESGFMRVNLFGNGKVSKFPVVYRTDSLDYEFDGWYTAKDGGEKVTENTVFNGYTILYDCWSASNIDSGKIINSITIPNSALVNGYTEIDYINASAAVNMAGVVNSKLYAVYNGLNAYGSQVTGAETIDTSKDYSVVTTIRLENGYYFAPNISLTAQHGVRAGVTYHAIVDGVGVTTNTWNSLATTVQICINFPAGGNNNVGFTTEPQSGVVEAGQPYNFTWAVSGAPTAAELQMKNGNDWAKVDNLTVGNANGAIAAQTGTKTYRVFVTYANGSIYSNEFTVTWFDANANQFSMSPTSGTVKNGTDYAFTWACVQTPATATIERKVGDDWNNPEDLGTATSRTITYKDAYANSTQTFRIKATMATGDPFYSEEFTVTYKSTPLFSVQPGNGKVAVGSTYTVNYTVQTSAGDGEFDGNNSVLQKKNGGNWENVSTSVYATETVVPAQNSATTETYRVGIKIGSNDHLYSEPFTVQWVDDYTFELDKDSLAWGSIAKSDYYGEYAKMIKIMHTGTKTGALKYDTPTNFDVYYWDGAYYDTLTFTPKSSLAAGTYNETVNVWVTSNGSDELEKKTINLSITIEAPTYTISFDANGGTGSMASVPNTTGTYELPACAFTAPANKEFKAWQVNGGEEKNPGESIIVTGNTVLTALWKDLPVVSGYTITFDAGGGSGTMAPVAGASGNYHLPSCTFTAPANKQFKAWQVNGQGEYQPGAVITVTANTTVTALWKDIPVNYYTVYISSANVCGVSGSYNTTQYVEQGQAMTDIIITANDGYYFPTSLNVPEQNGVTVTRIDYTQVKISGTPTSNVTLGFGPNTKTKESTPNNLYFEATGADTGNLCNLENGVTYAVSGAATAEFTATGSTYALTNVTEGTLNVVKKASDPNTKLDSDAYGYTVGKHATIPNVTSFNCTDANNNNGQIWNVSVEMEYQKEGDNSWTPGTGSNITGLTPGTYYVRYKASSNILASDPKTITIAAYNVPALTGTVTITGTAKYNEQLTATVTDSNNTGDLYYQWVRNTSNISGATGENYTLVEADIGTTIKVVVTSSVESGSITSDVTATVEKADGPVAPTGLAGVAPTTNGGSDGKITGTANTMEYSTDSSFTNPTGTVCTDTETTGLTAGTYYVRVKETATHKAGAYATVTVPAANVPAALTGTVTINGDAKYGSTLTAVVTGSNNTGTLSYQWKRGSTNIGTNSTTYAIGEDDIGSTITVTVTSSVETGEITSIATVTIEKADGPAAPNVTPIACTNGSNNDGKITGVTTAMEYSTASDFASKTTCTGTEITNLTNGTYYVRVAETATHKAGAAATVNVPAYVAAPTYEVTVTNGTATPSGAQAEGTSVTITANAPENGKMFDKWVVTGVTVADETAATTTFTMPAGAVTATATYKDIPVTTYEVTVTNGTASPSGEQAAGTSVTITANAAPAGKQFKEWTGADNLTFTSGSKTTATATFTMPAEAVSVTATYEDIPVTTYTITFNANGGSVTPASAETGADGKLASLPTPTRSGSYSFKGWYTATSGGTKVTTSTVFNANTTIYAQWTYTGGGGGGGGYVSTYAITVEDAKNGDVTASQTSAYQGTTVTVTVEPDTGYTLETLTVTDKNGKEIELTNKGDGKYTFKMPASKVTVKATFMDDNTMLNFFVDVPADAYYYDAVLWAVKEGITNGTSATTFSPDNPCTRAQMVTFLWRAAGSPEPVGKTCIFTDVPADAYYAKAVQWAYEQKITVGTSATTFSPDETCTRAQMATFLCRMADGKPVSNTIAFTDVKADAYYAESVQWAVENGITKGTGDNKFSPDATCTRAQMVTFLYRYFVK